MFQLSQNLRQFKKKGKNSKKNEIILFENQGVKLEVNTKII